jgi:hypothetical protein
VLKKQSIQKFNRLFPFTENKKLNCARRNKTATKIYHKQATECVLTCGDIVYNTQTVRGRIGTEFRQNGAPSS